MNDPYSVLGVSPNASDEEVRRAYRELARKYHPDNYQNNPLADLAEEKMKEINEAYEVINKQRSGQGGYRQPGGQSAYQHSGAYQSAGQSQRQYGYAGQDFARVREMISTGQLHTAKAALSAMPQRGAEWYFLDGSIAYRMGWLDEALQSYTRAVQMDPGNPEYQQALAFARRGAPRYTPSGYGGVSARCDSCDICTTLMCLNCLCGRGGC